MKTTKKHILAFLFITTVSKCFSQTPRDTIFPEFKNGPSALFTYVNKNTKYPSDARDKRISGQVFLKFTVDTMGAIVDAQVIKGLYPSLDTEAIRIIKSTSGMWTCGLVRNKKMKLSTKIGIKFKIQD